MAHSPLNPFARSTHVPLPNFGQHIAHQLGFSICRAVKLISPTVGASETVSDAALAGALEALEAIATDDPTTDSDNGHALTVCKAKSHLPHTRPSRHHPPPPPQVSP